MGLSLVALPSVICGTQSTLGGIVFRMRSNHPMQFCVGKPLLTSRDLMRYRTIRPLKAARVWLSKSGMLIPGEHSAQERIQLKQIIPRWSSREDHLAVRLHACDIVD